jgi:hypothetical protein
MAQRQGVKRRCDRLVRRVREVLRSEVESRTGGVMATKSKAKPKPEPEPREEESREEEQDESPADKAPAKQSGRDPNQNDDEDLTFSIKGNRITVDLENDDRAPETLRAIADLVDGI